MIVDHHKFHLAVPVEEVYAFLIVPENMLSLVPRDSSMTIANVEVKPKGGYRYEVLYRLAGMNITTLTETVELIPDEKLVIESNGQISGKTIWTLTADNEGTLVDLRYEYAEPEDTFRAIARSVSNLVIRSTFYEIANNARSLIKPRKAD